MAYAFEHGESIGDGATRIIESELADAIDDLTDVIDDNQAKAVHDCRKRLKKIRAVARLVRPGLGGSYDVVNRHARDAARELSPLRDATALAATFAAQADKLVDADDQALNDTFGQVSGIMSARGAATEAELSSELGAIRRAIGELEQLHELVDGPTVDEDGWDAIADGLARTYRRGRKGLARSIESPTPEHFHEWRKRVKYTRHHMDLLGPSASEILVPLERALHDLSDLLGDAHDLAVIGDFIRSDDPVVARIDGVERVGLLLDGARDDLERRSVALGRRLYAEKPKRFTKRVGTYWDIWR